MSDNLATGIVSVALAVIGVATLAVIVSTKSNTSKVIGAGASGLAMDIQAAVSPVTGQSVNTSSSAFG